MGYYSSPQQKVTFPLVAFCCSAPVSDYSKNKQETDPMGDCDGRSRDFNGGYGGIRIGNEIN